MSGSSGSNATPSVQLCAEQDHAAWQGVLVVKPNPVFDPVAWLNEGGLASSALQGYAKTHVLTGVSVPLALLALVLLFSLLFVGWRCLRCCCCSSLSVHVRPGKELKSPWLTAHQAFVAIFSLSAIAFCVLGIVKLPKHAATGLQDRAQSSLSYADSIVDQLAILQQSILPGLNSSLQPVQDILNQDINAPVVLAQLQVVEPFLDGLPAPKPLYDALSAIHRIVDQQLTPSLDSLDTLLNTTSASLLPSVEELATAPVLLNTIQGALQRLNDTVVALPTSFNDSSTQPAVDNLKAALGALHLDTWTADLQVIAPAMDALESARNTSLLPSIVSTCNVLLQYRSTALAGLQVLLPGLTTLDNLHPDSLLGVLPDLIARMEHVNTTILQLDNNTSNTMDLMRTAVHAIQQLYPMESANGNSNTTSGAINGTVGKLDLTTSLSDWIVQLQQLNGTVVNTSGWQDLRQQVGEPQQLLQGLPPTQPVRTALEALTALLKTLQGPSSQLQLFLQGNSLNSSQAEGSYAALLSAVGSIQAPLSTANTFLTAAMSNSVAQLYLQSSQAINDTLAPLAGNVSMGQQLLRQVRQEVLKLPDLSGPLNMLNATLDMWNQLPTPHSLVLSGPRQLLTSTVADCNKSVQDVRDQLQNAQDQIDSLTTNLQSQYMPDIKQHVWDVFDVVDHYWSYAHKSLLAGYAALIGSAVLLMAVTLLRCPCGLVAGLVLQLLLALLWLVVALVAMAGLVVLQDGCTYAEPLIMGQVSDTNTGLLLAQHYLYGQGADIKAVLKESGVIDIDEMMDSMLTAEANMVNKLQEQYKLQPYLSNVLYNITQDVQAVQQQVNNLLAMASYTPVHAQYMALKSEVCCWTGAEVFSFWVYITAAGLLAWVACVAGKAVLGRLDLLPRDNCLGLQCYRTRDYEDLDEEDPRKAHFLRRRQPPALPLAHAPPADHPPHMHMPPQIMGMGPGVGGTEPKPPGVVSPPQPAAVYAVPSGLGTASDSADSAHAGEVPGQALHTSQSGDWRVPVGLAADAQPDVPAADKQWPPPARRTAELYADATALAPALSHAQSNSATSESGNGVGTGDAVQQPANVAGNQACTLANADSTNHTESANGMQNGNETSGLNGAASSSSAERQSSFWLLPPAAQTQPANDLVTHGNTAAPDAGSGGSRQ